MPYYQKPKSMRPVHWFYAVLTVFALVVLYWAYVLHAVDVRVEVTPDVLIPDGQSKATIRVVLFNRIGTEVPGTAARITCKAITGADLAELSYNEDHTKAFVTAGLREGKIEVRVTSPELVFPRSVIILIQSLRA